MSTVLALLRGELSGLVADRNALGLLAAVGLVLGIAAILGAAAGLDFFFFIAFLLVPLFTTAIGAIQVSGERATGYSAVLHTAPISPRAYYAAKLLMGFVWALLAVAMGWAYVLFFAVVAGPGVLAWAATWLPVALVLCAYGASLGLLLSVLVGKRGLLPSAFAGLGLAIAMALVPLFLAFLPRAMQESLQGLARLSPVVNLLGDAPGGPSPALLSTTEGLQGFLAVAYFAAVFAAVGALVYLRHQNPEGWDAGPRRALPLLVLGAALIVAPALVLGDPDEAGLAEQAAARERIPFVAGFATDAGPQGLIVLAQGTPRRLELVLGIGNLGESVDGPAPPFRTAQAPVRTTEPLTNVTVRFEARPPLRIEPASVRLPDWRVEDCPGEARVPCRDYQVRRVNVTAVFDAAPSLGRAFAGFAATLQSDQGIVTTFLGGGLTMQPPPSAWWWPLLVWLGLVGAFAAPQALRARKLGRTVELQVVRRTTK